MYRGRLTGWQGRTTAEVVAVKTLKGTNTGRGGGQVGSLSPLQNTPASLSRESFKCV